MNNLRVPFALQTPPDTPYDSGSEPESKKESTAARIVRLASLIDICCNAHDFDFAGPEGQELIGHIAPEFTAAIDCIRHPDKVFSWEGVVDAWRRGAEEDPNVKFAWTSVSSTIDEGRGFAQVFIEKEITGIGNLRFHVMEEQQWRREYDKWLLVSIMGMRGTPANSGFGSDDMAASMPGMVEQLRARPYSEEPR